MRPEESGGAAWSASSADIPDDWEPYRPGDASPDDGVPVEQARGYADAHRLRGGLADRLGLGDTDAPVRPGSPPAADTGRKEGGGRGWTERSERRTERGQRVTATDNLGNGIFATTRKDERGEVIGRRHTVFSGEVYDVKFESGRIERDVKADQFEHRKWYD